MDITAILSEWGRYVRSEQTLPQGLGYSPSSAGFSDGGSHYRKPREQDAAAKLSETAWKRKQARKDMIPLAQPKQTRSRKGISPKYEPWPVYVRQVSQAVVVLPDHEQAAIVAKYVLQLGRPSAIAALRENYGEYTDVGYRELLARAEGAIRSIVERAA